MKPLIINAAITGMVPMKSGTPHVPISPQEIIAEAKRVRDAGATIIHLHARDPDGTPTYRKELYAEIFDGIREECPELLLSGSCSGRLFSEFWQRSQVLELQPDFGSLTLGSLNFPQHESVNSPDMIEQLATKMLALNVVPELEIFDLGMTELTHYLLRKGILRRPLYVNFLLGSRGTISATPDNLCALVRALPEETTWAATGIGRFQFFVNSLAIAMGGHVRVGLEDCIYYDWKTRRLATNAGLIDRVVGLARAAGREVATATQAREMIGLHKRHSHIIRAA